jgi:hypothetical protein
MHLRELFSTLRRRCSLLWSNPYPHLDKFLSLGPIRPVFSCAKPLVAARGSNEKGWASQAETRRKRRSLPRAEGTGSKDSLVVLGCEPSVIFNKTWLWRGDTGVLAAGHCNVSRESIGPFSFFAPSCPDSSWMANCDRLPASPERRRNHAGRSHAAISDSDRRMPSIPRCSSSLIIHVGIGWH